MIRRSTRDYPAARLHARAEDELGNLLVDCGRLTEAFKLLSGALDERMQLRANERAPRFNCLLAMSDLAASEHNLGRAFWRDKQRSKAIGLHINAKEHFLEILPQALDSDSNESSSLRNLARGLTNLGQSFLGCRLFDDAQDAVNEAFKFSARLPNSDMENADFLKDRAYQFVLRAQLRNHTRDHEGAKLDWEAAQAHFQAALDLDTEAAGCRGALAEVNSRLKKLNASVVSQKL